ncbi:accessory factor UbiK family protein [Thermithiobacillus plumbiphilus]|uniref:Ubiquinone biosynthesis accessory factor UbiK n=1 Tax=Thermithiobacillus plumbiphilus TaxID=1729899 RepID=A0ABU9D9G5_9PROT
MTRNTLLDELVRGVTETVVRLGSVKDDVEKQVRATISASLERLDVVTRDEMEVQRALVSRLRERVELLEQRVNAMGGGGQPDPDDAEQAGLATGRKPERPNTAASGQWANDEPGAD